MFVTIQKKSLHVKTSEVKANQVNAREQCACVCVCVCVYLCACACPLSERVSGQNF